jgi:type IV secretory pathway TraG/TraD family ATPase VirD4
MRELLTNTLSIVIYAYPEVTIDAILDLVRKAPRVETQTTVGYEAFEAICRKAREACPNHELEDLEKSISYFYDFFSPMADKTRSIIVSSLVSFIDPIQRAPLSDLFCKQTTLTPEVCFEGKILVIDLPVHSFKLAGQIANLIWKISFQHACLQRMNKTTPVFLWIDESQYLIDSSDATFQTTARSSLCCSVFLTQNISNLQAELKDKAKVESLLGSLHTKIFHQNDNYETNHWASQMIAKLPTEMHSVSEKLWSFDRFFDDRSTKTQSIQWLDDLPVRAFLNLKSGGPENNNIVEGIVFFGGKKFSSQKPWMKADFKQR